MTEITLTEAWVDLLDQGLEQDGCHGFYADHIHTNRAVMQIVAEAKLQALAEVDALIRVARPTGVWLESAFGILAALRNSWDAEGEAK